MRIMIMGYSGSGKSTLARKYGDKYNIDVLHLDTVNFSSGWKIRTYEEKEKDIRSFLDNHDEWVIDGNYTRYFLNERTDKADKIILLLFNRFNCLYRVIKRYFVFRGKSRPDISEGCNEKIDFEFIHWILYEGRTVEKKKVFTDIISAYPEKTIVIKNQKQLDRLLEKENI